MLRRLNPALWCRPEPIAKVLRLLPKLAVVFIIVHVAVIIYSATRPLVQDGFKGKSPGKLHFKLPSDPHSKIMLDSNTTLLNKTLNEDSGESGRLKNLGILKKKRLKNYKSKNLDTGR